MARRSRPPRNRKASNSEAPRDDVAVLVRLAESPEVRVSEAAAPSVDPPSDELAELDAGWD
jgi:hypothetical protein